MTGSGVPAAAGLVLPVQDAPSLATARQTARTLLGSGLPAAAPVQLWRLAGDGQTSAVADRAPTLAALALGDVEVGESGLLRLAVGADGPLRGVTVLVTRTLAESAVTGLALARQGARAVAFPCLEFQPPVDDGQELRRVLAAAAQSFDDLLITSAHGAAAVAAACAGLGQPPSRLLTGLRVAAVGPGTAAALAEVGLVAEVVADEQRGEGLAATLLAASDGPRRALFPRAAGARDVLPKLLGAAGWQVTEVTAYRTGLPRAWRPQALVRWLEREGVGAALFASPSAVRHFLALAGPAGARALLGQALLGAIGPITAEAMRQEGLPVGLMPARYTFEELTAALSDALRS